METLLFAMTSTTPVLAPLSAPPARFFSHSFGTVHVHQATKNFGFQVAMKQELGTGFLQFSLTSPEAPNAGQFAIRLALETGDLLDAANQTGIIGNIQQSLVALRDANAPILLRWSVDHHGGALIPRLEVGDEEWLYPAVRFAPACLYRASVSLAQTTCTLSQGYVWCQDKIKR